jgi:hypothetical protein
MPLLLLPCANCWWPSKSGRLPKLGAVFCCADHHQRRSSVVARQKLRAHIADRQPHTHSPTHPPNSLTHTQTHTQTHARTHARRCTRAHGSAQADDARALVQTGSFQHYSRPQSRYHRRRCCCCCCPPRPCAQGSSFRPQSSVLAAQPSKGCRPAADVGGGHGHGHLYRHRPRDRQGR